MEKNLRDVSPGAQFNRERMVAKKGLTGAENRPRRPRRKASRRCAMNLSERTLKVNGRSMTLALEQELWARLDQRARELNCKVEVLVDLMLSGSSATGSFVSSRASAS